MIPASGDFVSDSHHIGDSLLRVTIVGHHSTDSRCVRIEERRKWGQGKWGQKEMGSGTINSKCLLSGNVRRTCAVGLDVGDISGGSWSRVTKYILSPLAQNLLSTLDPDSAVAKPHASGLRLPPVSETIHSLISTIKKPPWRVEFFNSGAVWLR